MSIQQDDQVLTSISPPSARSVTTNSAHTDRHVNTRKAQSRFIRDCITLTGLKHDTLRISLQLLDDNGSFPSFLTSDKVNHEEDLDTRNKLDSLKAYIPALVAGLQTNHGGENPALIAQRWAWGMRSRGSRRLSVSESGAVNTQTPMLFDDEGFAMIDLSAAPLHHSLSPAVTQPMTDNRNPNRTEEVDQSSPISLARHRTSIVRHPPVRYIQLWNPTLRVPSINRSQEAVRIWLDNLPGEPEFGGEEQERLDQPFRSIQDM